jgi:hypothetical protein
VQSVELEYWVGSPTATDYVDFLVHLIKIRLLDQLQYHTSVNQTKAMIAVFQMSMSISYAPSANSLLFLLHVVPLCWD